MSDDQSRKRNAAARTGIAYLEASQARIIREYLLGDTTALTRLRALDGQIAALRPQIDDGTPP